MKHEDPQGHMASTSDRPVVAVDLGGTKIAAALVAPSGQILDRARTPTIAAEGPGPVIERVWAIIDRILERAGLTPVDTAGICIAEAGPIDMERGIVSTSPNLPGWESVPLRSIIRDKYAVRSFLINDAKAATLGEHRFGAGKGTNNMLCVMLGTGIGVGIVINGHLYLGKSGAAGEGGHMTIDVNGPKCPCGNVGCWELFASGTAMEREGARRLASGEVSILTHLAAAGGSITAEAITDAAKKGDTMALGILSRSATYLGAGLVNLANIFNPEMIVVGGGLSKTGDILLQPAANMVSQRAFPLVSQAVRIVRSTIDDDAGVLGAAAFAFDGGRV
jgi:glucokinase